MRSSFARARARVLECGREEKRLLTVQEQKEKNTHILTHHPHTYRHFQFKFYMHARCAYSLARSYTYTLVHPLFLHFDLSFVCEKTFVSMFRRKTLEFAPPFHFISFFSLLVFLIVNRDKKNVLKYLFFALTWYHISIFVFTIPKYRIEWLNLQCAWKIACYVQGHSKINRVCYNIYFEHTFYRSSE